MAIDLRVSQLEAGFLKNSLRRRGLPDDFGQAIAFLAGQIRDHDHLAQMLTSMEAEERVDFLEAVRPHLKFQAKPLDMYVSAMGQRAEREQWPVQGEDGKLQPFKPAADASTAERAIAQLMAERTLTLTCIKCTIQEDFYMVGLATAVDVRKKALLAGWTLHPEVICPTCPSLRPNA